MQSGAEFRHQWPLPADVLIEDMAHNLSKICRYSGAVEGDDVIYSVAEHCVRASYIGSKYQLEKLLHDAGESYSMDMPRPLKYSPFMHTVYKFYERMTEHVVALKFKLDTSAASEREVKRVDKILLVTEKRDLFEKDRRMCLTKMDDAEGVLPLPIKIEPWSPEQAKRAFLMRFYELTGEKTFYVSKMTVDDWLHAAMLISLRLLSIPPRESIIFTNLQLPAVNY